MSTFRQHAIDGLRTVDTSHLASGSRFVIEQRITAGDELIDHYHVVIENGSIDVTRGPSESPNVIMTQDAQTAEALRDGTLHAQAAFLTGRMSIDGDINGLLEFGPVLAGLLASRPADA